MSEIARYEKEPHPVEMLGQKGGRSLYVFSDLKDVLEDSPSGRGLVDELERRTRDGSDVLIWSRVVPDYRYSDRFGRDDRWFARGLSGDAERRDRWRSLALEFRSYALDDSTGNQPSLPPNAIGRALRREALANPELRQVAKDLASGATDADTPGSVVTRFRKCAASCFHKVWAESTHEERLALYALARGGVVDSRRTAALSSLVNRGIVEEGASTGVIDLRSEAFREFIAHDVDHGELDAWRKEGGGGHWRLLWPLVAIGGALGLAFLALANPEVRATLLTALVGLLPAVLTALSGGRGTGTATGS